MRYLKACLTLLLTMRLFCWPNDSCAGTKKAGPKTPIKIGRLIALQIEYSLLVGQPHKIKRNYGVVPYWPNINLQITGAELSTGLRLDSPWEVLPLYFQMGVSNLYYGRPVQNKYSHTRNYLFWYRRVGVVKNLPIGTFEIGIHYLKNFKGKDNFSAFMGSMTYTKKIRNNGFNASLGYSRQKMRLNLTGDIFDPSWLHPVEIILPFKEDRLYLSVQFFKAMGPVTPFVEVAGSKLLSSDVGLAPPKLAQFIIIGVQIQTRQWERASSRVHQLTYPKKMYPDIEVH